MDSESIQQPISGVSHLTFLIIVIHSNFLIIAIVLLFLLYHILLN
jgi:hypothetical protein